MKWIARPDRRLRALILVILLQLIFVSASYPRVQRAPDNSPAREAEEQHRRNHNFDEQHMRLELRLEPDKKRVIGRVVHTIQPLAGGLDSIELDAVGLEITKVELDDGTPLPIDLSKERLTIHFDHHYRQEETITFAVEYSTTQPKKGITFVEPDPGYPNRPRQIWSQGEAEECRYWIPLYDHPDDKATVETLITVPHPLTAVGNGKLIKVAENPDGTRTFHWAQSKPHACYLTTVSAADYSEIQEKRGSGVPILYYTFKDKVRDTARTFAKTPAMMAFFEEKTGFPYPWEKYAVVLASGFPGAMENTSATTMMDGAVQDERAALDVSSDDLASHELAHQWWGNMVSFRNWSDLWLSEGFASYAEFLWEEHDQGWDQASYARMQESRQYIDQARQHPRPIVYTRYEDPEELFDSTTYAKGGAVLHMLRFVLGDDDFWKAQRHYLRKHAFRNVDTSDLKIAIQEATGQDLSWFFDEWLYQSGWPDFEISQRYDATQKAVKLQVRQVQETNDRVPVFRMPVDVEIVTASGRRVQRVMVDQKDQEFSLSAETAPLLVNFDPRDWILKTLSFKKTKAEWLYQLKHGEPALNRIKAVKELRAHVAEDEVIGALKDAMMRDRFWAVRSQAAQVLSEQEGERILAILVQGLKDSDAQVRRTVLPGLAKYKDERTVRLLKRVFEHDRSYFAAAAAVTSLSQIGGAAAREVVLAALNRDSYQEVIRTAGLNGLIAMNDDRTVETALEFAAYGKPSLLRTAAIRALGRFGQGRHDITLRLIGFLKDQSTFVRLTTVSALGNLGDARALSPLKELFEGETNPALQGAAHQAIERIHAAVRKAREVERKAA